MSAAVMSQVEAEWVRAVVWPPAYREMDGPPIIPGEEWGRCACEPRVCPRCTGWGNPLLVHHGLCQSRTDLARGWWGVRLEAVITRFDGSPLSEFEGRTLLGRVWRANGPPCRWRCSCPCDKTADHGPRTVRLSPAPRPAKEPTTVAVPVQPDLFDLLGD